MSALGQKETSEDVRGNVRFTPNSAPHSLFNWLPSSHHHFTRCRLVIMSQGFQTVHLAARPERRNNHSQHFSLWGLGRRVERLGSRFHRTIVSSDANFHKE